MRSAKRTHDRYSLNCNPKQTYNALQDQSCISYFASLPGFKRIQNLKQSFTQMRKSNRSGKQIDIITKTQQAILQKSKEPNNIFQKRFDSSYLTPVSVSKQQKKFFSQRASFYKRRKQTYFEHSNMNFSFSTQNDSQSAHLKKNKQIEQKNQKQQKRFSKYFNNSRNSCKKNQTKMFLSNNFQGQNHNQPLNLIQMTQLNNSNIAVQRKKSQQIHSNIRQKQKKNKTQSIKYHYLYGKFLGISVGISDPISFQTIAKFSPKLQTKNTSQFFSSPFITALVPQSKPAYLQCSVSVSLESHDTPMSQSDQPFDQDKFWLNFIAVSQPIKCQNLACFTSHKIKIEYQAKSLFKIFKNFQQEIYQHIYSKHFLQSQKQLIQNEEISQKCSFTKQDFEQEFSKAFRKNQDPIKVETKKTKSLMPFPKMKNDSV